MISSTRKSTAHHGLSVLAFGAVAMAALTGHGKAGLTGGDDGGLDIPGLGNSTPQSCTLTSSDPRNKDSCNVSGNNGSDGSPGYVHQNSPHRRYSDDSDSRRYQDDSDH
jgi:hypothetical protein